MKRYQFIVAIALFAAVPLTLLAAVPVEFKVKADRADCLYGCGEKASFTVTVVDSSGKALSAGRFKARLDNFGERVLAEKEFDLAHDNPFTIAAVKDTPGFMRLSFSVDTNAFTLPKTPGQQTFNWGVAYEPEKICPGAENPADFDSFWADAVRKLDETVPLDMRIEKLDAKSTAHHTYSRISFATCDGRRVWGWLNMPMGNGPFPVRVNVPGAGIGALGTEISDKIITLTMNVHSYPQPDTEAERKADYKAQDEKYAAPCGVARYCQAGIHLSRENYFYYASILGINRAVNWLWNQPQVDHKRFTYSGTSQGGGFGFMLTALNGHFTRSCIFVPAITDLLGSRHEDRQSGWPRIIEAQKPENRAAAERNAPYFDGVNFAARITCPVRVVVGFADCVCPPAGVYAAYNLIPSRDKKIIHGIGMGHSVYGRLYRELREWEVSDGELATSAGCGAVARPLDPMVPINPDMADAKTLAADLRSARERWGMRRFVLTGPHAVNTQFNKTGVDEYRKLGERIAEVRANLAGTDIEIGWWLAPTLRQGRDVPGQQIVDCEGRASDAVCPLDPDFAKRLTDGIAATCRAGHPFIVFFEDDYELMWHRGMNGLGGCFCDRHMAMFAERYGKRLSAAEIAAAFRNRTADNEPLRKAFAETQKASLVQFAQSIRHAIDGVDPAIRTCLCQSYRVDLDGDTTEAIARALAGGTRPAVRIYGARYNNENQAAKLPQTLAHTAWSVATLPKDIELIHESDPYPHNRFFSAASFLGSEIACAFMCGVSDSYLYCSQYLDDPFEDGGYADWFSRNRRRLEVVRDFRAKARPVGVRVSFSPKEHYLVREADPGKKLDFLSDGTYFLGKLGFPYTAVGGDVTILSAQSIEQMPDDAVRRELSGGVLLDGAAALALSERGFNGLMGVAPVRVDRLPVTKERILPAAGCSKRGKNVNCWLLDPVGGAEASVLLKLAPFPGAEAWAEYVGPNGDAVAPSITCFKNALGGRVAVLSQGLSGNRSSSIYSPRKQELFANLFGKLSEGRLDVCAPETPCTWVLACVSEDGSEMLAMVNNLAGETRDDVVLRLSGKWRTARVARLGADGTWQPLGKAEGQMWRPSIAFQHMTPEFFRFYDIMRGVLEKGKKEENGKCL